MFRDETMRDDWPIIGMADWPKFGVKLEAGQIDILAQMVELSRDGYRVMEAARGYTAFDFDPDNDLNLQQKLEILGDLRHLARRLSIRHILMAANNRPNEAAEAIRDLFLIATALRQEETLISTLVDLSITAMGGNQVEESLSRQVFPDSALVTMQQALMTAIHRPDTLTLLKRDTQRDVARWLDPDEAINRTIAQYNYTTDLWDQIRQTIHEEWHGTPYELVETWWGDWVNRISFAYFWLSPGTAQLQIVQEYDYLLQALEQIETNGEIDPAFVEQAKDEGFFTPNVVVSTLRTFSQGPTLLRCQIFGIEAERYRLREGDWPTSIEQIEITDLPPIDAWGNRLAVTKTPNGFKVYSFGDNGQDDGGTDRWDDYDWADYPDGEPDDWNITLLDPEVRGTLQSELESDPSDFPGGGYPGYSE